MKSFSRRLLFASSLTAAMPLYLAYRIIGMIIGAHRIFPGFSQFLSLFPGLSGILLRRGFYCMTLKCCSSASTIDFGTFFSSVDVTVGEQVYIGANSIIASCIIEDDVIVGSGVHVVSKNTHHFTSVDKPIRVQGGDWQPIRVGRDCWIGNGVIVMADIGDQCVIGAGSVVTKPVEDRSIVAGNPARLIRKRQ